MVPLSKLHRHLSVPLWYLSIYIFFTASVFFIQKILSDQDKQKVLSKTFYIFAVLMSLRFLLSVVQRVQSDAIVLILLSLFIYALFRRKEGLAGLSLASAIMVKLTPLIFLPYLLLKKKIKAANACVGGLIFYALLPSIFVGPGKNIEYLRNWFLVHRNNPSGYLIWYKNQSLFSTLARLLNKDSSVAILNLSQQAVLTIFIIVALVLFGLIFIPRRKIRLGSPGFAYLVEISLVLILMILLSPLAWKHTFVHLIIAHMVLLYYAIYINPQDKATRGLLIASFLFNTVLNPELTKPFAKIVQLYSSVVLGTVLLFAALLRISFRKA